MRAEVIRFVEQAFLFLGAGLGLVIVLILWGLVFVVLAQEVKHVFKPDKDEQPEETNEWERYE